MSLRNIILIGICFLLILTACRKKNEKASWEVSVVAPLITSTMTINNLLADSLLYSNPDNSLTIVFNNRLFHFSLDSIMSMPDNITYQCFHIPINTTVPPGQQILDISDDKNLAIGSAKITDIIARQGIVNLEVTNTIHEKVLCTYDIPSATKDGVPFQVSEMIPAAGITPAVFQKGFDLSGYNIDMRGPLHNKANILTTRIRAWIDSAGNSVAVTTSDSFLVSAKFDHVLLNYAKGYFGSESFTSTPDSTAFTLFNKIIDGTLNLEHVHMALNIINGFGVDAQVRLNNLTSINTRTHNSVALTGPIIGSNININRATETYVLSNPVNPSTYPISLDNTNIKLLIENLPDQLSYGVDFTSNPLGNVSSGNDFFYYDHGIDADLDMEIPLSLIANNLTLCDTVNFNITKPTNGSAIKDGTFTLIADNGFPFEATVQLYLLNNYNAVFDSLFTQGTIASAPLDVNNIVISKQRSKLLIPVTEEKMDRIYDAKKLRIVARFNTANSGQYIKIYNTYSIDFKLTGDFNYIVQP